MKKTNTTKYRIFFILDILQKYSDQDHPISMNDIIAKLALKNIDSSKYPIYDDINILNELGYDIVYQKNIGYYINHYFDETELKVIIDSLNSANFLSLNKTKELIAKVIDNNSLNQQKLLTASQYYSNAKVNNNKIYYNINSINEAKNNDLSITFYYFDLDINMQKKYRKEKKLYTLIPYDIIIHNQFYYCIGYSNKYQSFSHYRIDKMENIKPQHKAIKSVFDINEYTSRFIDMYIDQKTNVTLTCDNDLANMIFDKFSTNIMIIDKNDHNFTINLNIDPSITFISWLVLYKDKIKVLKPQSLIDNIKDTLNTIITNYN